MNCSCGLEEKHKLVMNEKAEQGGVHCQVLLVSQQHCTEITEGGG